MGKRGGGAGVQIVREDKDRVDNERQSPIINEVGLTELVGGQVENMDRFDSINVPVHCLCREIGVTKFVERGKGRETGTIEE